jgi:Membrane protease subunits, stomatin/prohibitin homologs
MALIIISVILAIAVFVTLGLERSGYKTEWRKSKLQALAFIPLLLIPFGFTTVIPANTVGILWSPFDGVKEETLSEGIQFKGIFDKVYKISTEVQSRTIHDITGQTRDSQYILITLDVKYKVNPSNAYEVFRQYRTLDNIAENFIAPTVQRSIEAVSTQYNVIEILGEERNEMYKGVEAELARRLTASGIAFVSINFDDTDAGHAIEQAIEAEAVAKKAVETAQQELLKVQADAQQIVVKTEAEKQQAQILAEIKVIEAQAEADANMIFANSINTEILNKMWIEKWDGSVPMIVGENSGGYMLDLGSGER